MSRSAMEFLGLCVALKKNIVISGGTGTDKTSMLNALSTEIGENERESCINPIQILEANLGYKLPCGTLANT